jgi:nitroreductase
MSSINQSVVGTSGADGQSGPVAASFDDLSVLVRSRRTIMLVDPGREVPVEVVEQLCELAQWAPNHKRTWPWRFALFTGEGRRRLGEAFVADMNDRDFGDEGKRAKTLGKYLRTPAVLVVGAAADDNPSRHDENRDAVAAGIQNILLGATAIGLATYWGTAPLIDSARVLELCEFEPDVRLVNVMYLGWGTTAPEPPARPPVRLTVVDH